MSDMTDVTGIHPYMYLVGEVTSPSYLHHWVVSPLSTSGHKNTPSPRATRAWNLPDLLLDNAYCLHPGAEGGGKMGGGETDT